MFIDGTLPEQQCAKNSMIFPYLDFKIYVQITEARMFCPLSKNL